LKQFFRPHGICPQRPAFISQPIKGASAPATGWDWKMENTSLKLNNLRQSAMIFALLCFTVATMAVAAPVFAQLRQLR
jgi:hypothetical protein